jgi:hypothetical protein
VKFTSVGTDYIAITEDNLKNDKLLSLPRVHLIKLMFFNPTEEKIKSVLSLYPRTNRFVIEDNIRIYNNTLKRTNKKYYVMNMPGIGFISFFRKNNKVLLNIENLSVFEKQFVLKVCLDDVLRNIEVIQLNREDFLEVEGRFERWNGNVVLNEDGYNI